MDGSSEKKQKYVEKQSIVIKITSRSEIIIEKVVDEIVSGTKERRLEFVGPFDSPPQVLKLRARHAPRDGVSVVRSYEMHLLKRIIKIYCTREVAKEIVSGTKHGTLVEVEYRDRALD